MHLYMNHCWCSDSNWGGVYDCRHILTIQRIGRGKDHDTPEEDWTNLTEEFEFFDEKEYMRWKKNWDDGAGKESKHKWSDEDIREFSTKTARRLKPEVIAWLNENVEDRDEKEGNPKGWCIGSDNYLALDTIKINLFFHRKSDALTFIREWSKYKKPVSFFNYFRDVRQELNFETNKIETVEEFSD